jgi:5-methylthioadenosine/S-adenosylhomocysteine deaminase
MVLKDCFTCMSGPAAVHLTVEDTHAAAMQGCLEVIRSGVTTLVDFVYAHPRPGLTRAGGLASHFWASRLAGASRALA